MSVDNFDEAIKNTKIGNQVILQEEGKDLAAIIPLEDFKLFEQLVEEMEDRLDVEEAEKILADPNEKRIPWDEAEKLLNQQ